MRGLAGSLRFLHPVRKYLSHSSWVAGRVFWVAVAVGVSLVTVCLGEEDCIPFFHPI